MSPTPPVRHMDLAIPFAALGLGGAFIAGDFFRVGCFAEDGRFAALLVMSVPLAAAALGHVLSQPRPGWSQVRPWLVCVASTCGLGTLIGAFIGVVCWSLPGFPMGAADGLACGSVFSVGFAVVLAWARRTGRARIGSLVEASDRRVVLAAVAALLGMGTVVASLRRNAYPGCTTPMPTMLPIVKAFVLATLVLLMAWQAAHIAFLSRAKVRTVQFDQRSDGAIPAGTPCVDCGVGDGVRAEVVGLPSAYRDRGTPVRLLRGDAALARRALVQGLTQEAALLWATLVTMAVAH
jgi:MFS family permease